MDNIKKDPIFQHIFQYTGFSKEFNSMFGKSVPKRYQEWLYRRLIMLDREGKNAVDGVQIEKLKGKEGAAGLYSIRYARSKENPRVIYAHIFDDRYIILLTAFLEKNSNDYKVGSERALQRLKKVKEGINNG